MIKIRYRDPNELSPGLHAEAERHGRCTTVYLLSGLTAQERRAALRRLRLSARMGYCPPLPAAQLTLALFADRVRTSAGQTGTATATASGGTTASTGGGGGTTGGGTTASGTTGGGTTGSGTAGGAGTPAASTSTQAAAPSTSAAPAPQPTPTASSTSGVCVDVGPLGVCLKL